MGDSEQKYIISNHTGHTTMPSLLLHTTQPDKERCISGHTQYYYTDEGISYKCRHCKHVEVRTWEEILQQYRKHGGRIT